MRAYYHDLLQVKSTLKVLISDSENDDRTFNMNGTIEIPGVGTVYSSIKGRDKSGKNFGSFKTIDNKDTLGNAGKLMLNDSKTLVFPMPVKNEGNKITGATYDIELNNG
ncbi:hypothetical protein H7F33_15690 [Pedobacter sp. PAMC26386]|nr:hypothetical protein H7F33_15690 [Pedobacter sp. PAMC26386]